MIQVSDRARAAPATRTRQAISGCSVRSIMVTARVRKKETGGGSEERAARTGLKVTYAYFRLDNAVRSNETLPTIRESHQLEATPVGLIALAFASVPKGEAV